MYRRRFSTRQTDQSEPIPGRESQMVLNEAGGYVFSIDKWARLDRFLIMGSEGGTYYVKESKLTKNNATSVVQCIKEDGPRVVARLCEISESGRAPKNDPALFVLAMCCAPVFANQETRRIAFLALPKVARIGTHLFHFLEYVEGFRGWGRGLRNAVSNWYNNMSVDKLAYQAVKYQQRNGWSHRDALRLAHPKVLDDSSDRNDLYKWIVGNPEAKYGDIDIVSAYEFAKVVKDAITVCDLIRNCGLTREMIPTNWLSNSHIWSALLEKMPLTAMIRNLGKMTQLGVISPMSDEAVFIARKLTDQKYIRNSRVHPLTVLVAMKVYSQGHGIRGNLSWSPVREITDALDKAFYLAFDNVEPTGKKTLIAVDVSGSMMWDTVAGMPLKPAEAAAALALVVARSEPQYHIVGFDDRVYPKAISPRQRLDDVIKSFGFNSGSTNCAAPITYAMQKHLEVDTFVIITDSDTWSGDPHPTQALQLYRQSMKRPAKMIILAMTSSDFTIADPDDAGQLDIVGFDTATPTIISDFSSH